MTQRLQQPASIQGASASMQGGAATVTVYFSDIEEAQDFAAKINRNVGEKYNPTLQSLGGDAGVSDAMVDAYLQANDAYWKRTDQLPTPPDKWRTGTPREATRESLRAALSLTSTEKSGRSDAD